MAQPYSPLAFANEFIVKSGPHGAVHMKLQKLVYMCYGWWLIAHDEPVINEPPEVWRHGPVFSSLYDTLKGFGHKPITTKQTQFFTREPDSVDDGDVEVHQLIDWVWSRYGQYDQFHLSELTHKKGSPWQVTAEQHNFRVPRHTEIPIDTIRDHFQSIAVERGFQTA